MAFDNLPDLGPMFTPEGNAYAAWVLDQAKAASAQFRVDFDIPFGGDAFQTLDVWRSRSSNGSDLPVLIYVHGGGWQKGYKEWNGILAHRVVNAPAILVSPNHRLAPAAKYPQQLADVFSALRWVYENIGRYGGSNRKIFIGGHSSGGHLAALATMRTDLLSTHGLPSDVVRACFPLSAPLDLRLEKCEPGGRREKQVRLFLERDSQDREASVVEHAPQARTPMLLGWGAVDFQEIIEHNRLMVERMAQNRACVFEHYVLPGATHNGTHKAWLDVPNPYVDRLLSWMKEPPGSTGRL